MKHVYFMIVTIQILAMSILSAPLEAKSNENSLGLNLEAGANGNYGIIGLEGSFFPSRRLDIHGGVGFGAAAALGGGGVRLYADPSECFWFKQCSDKYFLGANVSQTLSKEVTETGEDKVQRKYKIPRTTFVHAAVGSSTVFFDSVNLMLNLGYKFAVQKTEPEQVAGPDDENTGEELKSALKSGPQVSVAAGFLF